VAKGKREADRSVARNAAYRRGSLGLRERHNERKNESYMNGDIIPERSALNVHFKSPSEGYAKALDRMLESGAVSARGLGRDPHVVDELVFDVNTSYFDRNGGYEFAKGFFAEAYKCAAAEVGGGEYVISAVMHADEINRSESARLGRDVYHYHLHVVYVPVVDKEIRHTNCKKNRELGIAGQVRGTVKQISHSKKWPRGGEGEANSYSALQDHFFEHMARAGYKGFERGERKSGARHLSSLEFKTREELKRLEAAKREAGALEGALRDSRREAGALGEARLRLEGEAEALRAEAADLQRLCAELGREAESKAESVKSLDGRLESKKEDIAELAKEAASLRGGIAALRSMAAGQERERRALERENSGLRLEHGRLSEEMARLESERALWEGEAARLQDEAGRLKSGIGHGEARAALLGGEVERLERRRAALGAEIGELGRELARREAAAKALEDDAERLGGEAAKAAGRLDSLRRRCADREIALGNMSEIDGMASRVLGKAVLSQGDWESVSALAKAFWGAKALANEMSDENKRLAGANRELRAKMDRALGELRDLGLAREAMRADRAGMEAHAREALRIRAEKESAARMEGPRGRLDRGREPGLER
jgi:predicted  nucleic acid-binding Zn-ribbon protein